MTAPIITLKDLCVNFGDKEVLKNLNISFYAKDKICLIGKNGEGKTTLLKVISGELQGDEGNRWMLPGLKINVLSQQFSSNINQTVTEFLDSPSYEIDKICESLNLDKNQHLSKLSGGQLRRVYLAKTLLNEPDLILLDEPTNHLDISTIIWLENYLLNLKAALICVSHDKIFLRKISNKMLWLDQGNLLISDRGYDYWQQWSESILVQKETNFNKLSKKLINEQKWLHGGVTARRKRNQKRMTELGTLKSQINASHESIKNDSIKHVMSQNHARSKIVLEIQNISFEILSTTIIKDFSLTVTKGDRIGVIGPNGSGKSTLLNIISARIEPIGRIKLAKSTNITYHDQKLSCLNYDDSIRFNISGHSDYLDVGGSTIHVLSYLKNFMFDPKLADNKVDSLSGGQANRLALAKVLASSANLLILDEPTNDLDIETLEMVEDILLNFGGTLIIVSHDREFLNKITTKTLVFGSNGKIEEFFGNYHDYMQKEVIKVKSPIKKLATSVNIEKQMISKKSFKIQYELENLPKEIANIESVILDIEQQLSSIPYLSEALKYDSLAKELVLKKKLLDDLWQRLIEIDS